MSFKKPSHPLNTAIVMLSLAVCLHAVFTILLMALWICKVDCAALLTGVFLLLALLLIAYSAYALYCNTSSMCRDRFQLRSLTGLAVAGVLYAAAGLFNGYCINKINHAKERLEVHYYGILDDDKLCTEIMRGEDPADSKYTEKSPGEILKNGIPKFRGVYTGSFLDSFGDGGKLYIMLGRYCIAEMKKAYDANDSKAFGTHAQNTAKIIQNASQALRDPEQSARIITAEYISALQECLTSRFPEGRDFEKVVRALAVLHSNFEHNQLKEIVYLTQSVLNRYRSVLDGKEPVSAVMTNQNQTAWSEADLFAAKIFYPAGRNRLINDYGAAIELLNTYRIMRSAGGSSLKDRIKILSARREKLKAARHNIALALIPDIRSALAAPGHAQSLINTAHLAVELELYRRDNGVLPAELSHIENPRLMSIPNGHIDGSAYKIIKGRFLNSRDKKEYAGYAVSVPGYFFAIPVQ